MRTTLIIPDDLVKDLMEETSERNKTRLICQALEEMLKRVRRGKLKKLRGKIELDIDLETLRRKDLA